MPLASMDTSEPLDNNEYTIGWIAALSLERVAAEAMLDSRHGSRPRTQHLADTNMYTLGRIGEHNVVIASLPPGSYGIVAASTTAMQMISSFPSIRIGLLVGIGGGIPRLDEGYDIRLGDIVVSQPKNGQGGVVHYDAGKRTAEGKFQRGSWLAAPPRVLLNAVDRIQVMDEFGESNIPHILGKMQSEYPKLAVNRPGKPGYIHQGMLSDRLFKTTYNHPGGLTCSGCDRNEEIEREERDTRDPYVHYGVIASGSSVVKDGIARDSLGEDCLCFEMEAAGLMNDFPCLVIRGICDYADTHKTKQWQKYAAAVAAAYAKDLLGILPPKDLAETEKAADVIKAVEEVAQQVAAVKEKVDNGLAKTQNVLDTLAQGDEDALLEKICKWLADADYGPRQSDTIAKRHEGTGEWFLNSSEFRNWVKQDNQTLFSQGIPGAGKTTIASVVIDYLSKESEADTGIGVAYIYCDHQNQDKQTLSHILAVILKQLIQRQPEVPEDIKKDYQRHVAKKTRLSDDQLVQSLHSIAGLFSRIYVVIDAMDECQPSIDDLDDIIPSIFKLQSDTRMNILVTSRVIPEITRWFETSVKLDIRAIDSDVRKYLDAHLLKLRPFVRRDSKLQEEIKTKIIGSIDGMYGNPVRVRSHHVDLDHRFLLAKLHVESLRGLPSVGDIKHALASLPRRLEDTYGDAVKRIQSQRETPVEIAKEILSWVTYAKRQLSTRELCHALAARKSNKQLNEDYLIDDPDYFSSICAGLITVDKQSDIIRLVHYTAESYFRESGATFIPNAEIHISRICLVYVSFDTFESGFCSTDASYEEKLKHNPLYEYAAKNWGHHACAAETDTERSALSLLEGEQKLLGCTQAMLALKHHSRDVGYSQRVPQQVTAAHVAAYFNLGNVMTALFQEGHVIDLKDSTGQTPLCWAARYGNQEMVQLLLSGAYVKPDSKDSLDGTPLWWSARYGHSEIVKLLLATIGVDPDTKSRAGLTPLCWAAENGHTAVVRELTATGRVDVNFKDNEYSLSPLLRAAKKGHAKVVKLLIDGNSVDLDCADSRGRTPLSWAAANGHELVVKLLENANLDSRDSFGRTPLSYAAEAGRHTAVELLLTLGDINQGTICDQPGPGSAAREARTNRNRIDPDSRSSSDRSPLSYAAENGHESIVRLLLATGYAKPNSMSDSGRTPLSYAIERGHEAVALLLLDTGGIELDSVGEPLWQAAANQAADTETLVQRMLALGPIDINYKDTFAHRTPLQKAAENNKVGLVKLLLATNGVDPNSIDDLGCSPFWWAAGAGYDSVVELFLNCETVDRNARDSQWLSTPALTLSIQRKHYAVSELLIAADGVDLDAADDYGRTPLYWAARNGQVGLVKLLVVANGVNLNPRDNDGLTASSWAKRNGHEDVIAELRSAAEARGVTLDFETPPNTMSNRMTSKLATTYMEALEESVAPSLEITDSWVKSTVHRDLHITVTTDDIRKTPAGKVECVRYLSSGPLGLLNPNEQHPVRKVVFTITSRDQGWSSFPEFQGTYANSYSWFEANIRGVSGRIRNNRQVIVNIHAGREYKTHTLTWTFDAEDEEERAGRIMLPLLRSKRSRRWIIDLTLWAFVEQTIWQLWTLKCCKYGDGGIVRDLVHVQGMVIQGASEIFRVK
ncbi:hypothetical protein FQN55_004946 [Onygenales sp. PD_40]|nr:hypothetical protein FQN55_004946 [Onygenales sp. PD_40]